MFRAGPDPGLDDPALEFQVALDVGLGVGGFDQGQRRQDHHEVAPVRQAPGQGGQDRHPPAGQERRHRGGAGRVAEKVHQEAPGGGGVLVDDNPHRPVLAAGVP